MKGIIDDIRGIAANISDANWPASNLLDAHPRNLLKATDPDSHAPTVIITISMAATTLGATAVYIGNTNADTGGVVVDGAASVDLTFKSTSYFTMMVQKHLETFSQTWVDYSAINYDVHTTVVTLNCSGVSDIDIDTAGATYEAGTLSASGGGIANFFGTYTVNSSGNIDSVKIINPGTDHDGSTAIVVAPSHAGDGNAVLDGYSIVHAGIARCGFAREWQNPNYGLQEGFVDYSVYKEYHSGAEYVKPRDIVKTFSGILTIPYDEINVFHDLARQSRNFPIAWNLLGDDNEDQRGILFGKMRVLPRTVRNFPNYISTSFVIEEVL